MLRKMTFALALAGILLLSAPSYAQDPQPSLGDVARQARKDKENKAPAKTVITEDTLPSAKNLPGFSLGSFGGSSSGAGSSGGGSASGASAPAMANAYAKLDEADVALNRVAPMDRTTLARQALQGDTTNFPGRADWENRLYEAKQTYVTHGRDLLRETRQLLGQAEAMERSGQAKAGANDPHVQAILQRLQAVMQDANHTEAAFEAIVLEGKDLAKQRQ